MDDKKFLVILTLMFLFPLITSCEKKKEDIYEMPSFDAENEVNKETIIKDSSFDGTKAENNDFCIADAARCDKEEYTISYTKHFSSDINPEEIPESMDIVYYNSTLGCDLITKGNLSKKGIDETNTWCETIECEIVFMTDDYENSSWKTDFDDDITLSIDAEKPIWDGYEKDVLRIAGFYGMGYEPENAYWKGEVFGDGTYERKAVYVFSRNSKGYYGVYEGTAYDIKLEGEETFSKIDSDLKLLSEYRKRNEDVYGIVRIRDTELEHPVMRSGEDEDFYLWHDLDRNYNTRGIPFIGANADFEKSRGNTVIFGHKTLDGDVFGNLYKYEDIEYYKEHPFIETVSDNGTQKWLVIACFLVCMSDEDAFDYSDESAFMSLDGFEEYMENVEKRNFYITKEKFGINEAYLTLSSCSKEKTGNGTNRMAILAVRVPTDYEANDFIGSVKENPTPYLPEKMRDKD